MSQPLPQIDRNNGSLEWSLVVYTRRSWNAVSLAVLAMTGCFLLARHTGQLFTGPSGVLAVLAGCSSLVAVRLQQQIFRIRRALGRPTFLRQQPGA